MTAEAKTLLEMNYQEARQAAAEFLAEWGEDLGPKERNPVETLCSHHAMDLPPVALLIWKWAMANFSCLAERHTDRLVRDDRYGPQCVQATAVE